MANRRIRKKQILRKARNAASAGERPPPFSSTSVALSLPCPECRRFTLMRTYVPDLGSMNGTVECWRCGYRDQFVNALALDMQGADPVPAAFIAPKREHTTPPELLEPDSLWREMVSSMAVWARAAVRALRTPDQRPARAHSGSG